MQKKECRNCKRLMSIVKEGRCFVCSKACEGLEGEAKDAALAAIKAKIDGKQLRLGYRGGSRPGAGRRKAAGEKNGHDSAPSDRHAPDTALQGAEIKQKIDSGEVKVRGRGRDLPCPLPPVPPKKIAASLEGGPADIPVTIRLMVDISVRVSCVAG